MDMDNGHGHTVGVLVQYSRDGLSQTLNSGRAVSKDCQRALGKAVGIGKHLNCARILSELQPYQKRQLNPPA